MKVLKTSFIIIGSVIGAGFSSGKEIFEYFAKFGLYSFLFIIPLFFCFYFIIKLYLKYGEKHKELSVVNINSKLSKPANFFGLKINYLNIFMFITFLILSSAMFSGLVSLFKTYFPALSTPLLYLIIIVLTMLMINLSFKSLTTLSVVVVPLIIICIVFNSIYSYISQPLVPICVSTILPLPFLTLLYASQNTFLSMFIIIKSGNCLSKKEQKLTAITVSFCLCLLIILGILCFMFNPQIASANMPFAEIAININPLYSGIFGIIIFFSIITTYATTLTSLKEFFKGNKKHNKKYIMLILIVLLSLFDFGKIVEYLYPIIGVFGVIFCFILYNSLVPFKPFFNSSNNGVHSASKHTKNNRAS